LACAQIRKSRSHRARCRHQIPRSIDHCVLPPLLPKEEEYFSAPRVSCSPLHKGMHKPSDGPNNIHAVQVELPHRRQFVPLLQGDVACRCDGRLLSQPVDSSPRKRRAPSLVVAGDLMSRVR
jgi:hypothetical protein